MRSATVRGVGIALLIVGLVTTVWSVYSGLTRFYLVVIVPVFSSDNVFGMLPLLAIFAGIVLMALGPAFDEYEPYPAQMGESATADGNDAGRTKVGGVVLIGPIPILFGSDKKMTLMAAAIAIMILATIVLLLL